VLESKVTADLRELGSNVRCLRLALDLTQARLAERAGLNARTLRRIEAGEINLLITTVARLRAALNCSWPELMPHSWQ